MRRPFLRFLVVLGPRSAKREVTAAHWASRGVTLRARFPGVIQCGGNLRARADGFFHFQAAATGGTELSRTHRVELPSCTNLAGGARPPPKKHRRFRASIPQNGMSGQSIRLVAATVPFSMRPCHGISRDCSFLNKTSRVAFSGVVPRTSASHIATTGTHKIDLPMSARQRTILSPWRSSRSFRHGGDFCYMPSEDLWRPCAVNANRHETSDVYFGPVVVVHVQVHERKWD